MFVTSWEKVALYIIRTKRNVKDGKPLFILYLLIFGAFHLKMPFHFQIWMKVIIAWGKLFLGIKNKKLLLNFQSFNKADYYKSVTFYFNEAFCRMCRRADIVLECYLNNQWFKHASISRPSCLNKIKLSGTNNASDFDSLCFCHSGTLHRIWSQSKMSF